MCDFIIILHKSIDIISYDCFSDEIGDELERKKSKQLKAKKPLSSRARDTRQSLAQIGFLFLGREITGLAHATMNGGKLNLMGQMGTMLV